MDPRTTPPDLGLLARRFADGPAALRTAWDAVPAAARQWRPAPAKWSAHEIVLHCADATAVACARLRYLLAEDDPVIIGYDQDRWAASLDYHARDVAAAFAVMEAMTAFTVPLIRRLTPADLARTGRHTETGAITVGTWLPYNAEHLHTHARQIERNLAAFAART